MIAFSGYIFQRWNSLIVQLNYNQKNSKNHEKMKLFFGFLS